MGLSSHGKQDFIQMHPSAPYMHMNSVRVVPQKRAAMGSENSPRMVASL